MQVPIPGGSVAPAGGGVDVAPTTITTGNRPFGTVGGSDARDDGEGDDDDEMVDETIPLTPRETFSSPIIATLGRNNRPSGSAPGSFPGVDRHNHPQYTNHNPPRRTPASTSASLGYYLSFFRSPSTSTMEGDGAESECSSVPAPLLSSWLPRRNTNTTATPGSRQTNDLASTERNNHYDHHRPCLSYVSRAGNTYPHTTEPPPSTPSQGTDTALEPWYPSEDDDNHDDYYYDDDSYYNYYQNSMANRDASHQYWPNQDRDDTGSSMGIGIDTSRVDTGSQHESHSQDQSEKQHGNDDDEDGQDDGRSRHDEENPWTRSQSRVSIATYQETHPWHRELLRTVGEEVETWYEYVLQRSFRRASAAPPLSPRSRNLRDLQYLTQQHQTKIQQLTTASCLTTEPVEHYDFCLVLQPQEVYAYWSMLLDFRVELLGLETVQNMEAHWDSIYDTAQGHCRTRDDDLGQAHSTEHTTVSSSTPISASSSSSPTSSEGSEALDVVATSPTNTLRRRPKRGGGEHTPSTYHTRSTPIVSRPSPGMQSLAECSRVSGRGSIFDRAMGNSNLSSPFVMKSTISENSPAMSNIVGTMLTEMENGNLPPPPNSVTSNSTAVTTTIYRRRWGNQALPGASSYAISPPIRSLTRGSSTIRRSTVVRLPSAANREMRSSSIDTMDTDDKDSRAYQQKNQEPHNANITRMQDIPNQVIPRGIAARTNGMLAFLSALKRGIVLRRHRPRQSAILCKLWSTDGGDTIHFTPVEGYEASSAFKEQRMRYNKSKDCESLHWSRLDVEDGFAHTNMNRQNSQHRFDVPDYVAAKHYRDSMNHRQRNYWKKMQDVISNVSLAGSLKAADIVSVHPARNPDPRCAGEMGSQTLRKSKSEFSTPFAFSVVLRTRLAHRETLDELEDKWHKGLGNDTQFRYVDFEAATEGEYWLIFRGLLLLHRDAAVGRFAEQRAAGIGCHYPRLELEQREQFDLAAHNVLHQDEFHEPVTVGCLEKLIVKWRKLDAQYMEGYTLPGAVPPPSDYFLGFRSPGTAIWSRLRQAGFETQRVYSLDPRVVMIKIRCPSERLMDVAEVLRLNLKTRDGTYAPFRESMIGLYQDLDDPLETIPNNPGFQFKSSFRQAIVDFIIGSRIRDTGAELGQTTDLGKMIQARVPLHMHAKLNAIYDSWFYFWREENWKICTGRSMSHPREPLETTKPSEDTKHKDMEEVCPGLIKRFFFGCFFQPLDSIEEYFGEKVAFYFAWLQHTAAHLAFLSVAGLIMLFFQVGSQNWDHPLRPVFAMVVMMWTFITLINWRKRANHLAYRWGTMDYKEQETTRPQFRGDYVRDAITGEWIVTYPKWKRWLKYLISFPLTLLFTGGTLVAILWVHANRDIQLANYLNDGADAFTFDFAFTAIGKRQMVELELTRERLLDPTFWFIVVGMPSMLGLSLPLLNFILMKLSIMLNDFENYRTESEYRSYLIVKVFSFRFVCYFSTLYYYAFVSVGDDAAIQSGILRVGTGVLVYTTVAQWWQNFVHVCFPVLLRNIRKRYRERRLADELRSVELEEEEVSRMAFSGEIKEIKQRQVHLINKRLLLEQAQDDIWLDIMKPDHDSFPEYINAVVQFTFVSCFSVVLPITPLICLLNYLISMRLDAYKLCKGRRRPLSEKTGGIGVWEHLLQIVSVISILTNCWLMGFTSSTLTWIGAHGENGSIALFAIVVAWEHVMLLVRYIMQATVSPLPRSVSDEIRREQHELNQQRNSLMMSRRLQHQRDEDCRFASD